ncbi:hypothetical protein ECDEC7B_4937 [Escherichia coli DEC7B]|nr:hypothetical protein ECDEC7B_4937 [Escherichia coli DEC7B]
MPGAAGTVALNIRHVSKLIFTHLIVNTNKNKPCLLFYQRCYFKVRLK